jgi:hypothetical protein
MKKELIHKLDETAKKLNHLQKDHPSHGLGADFSCSITYTGLDSVVTDVRLSLTYSSGSVSETDQSIEDTVKFVILEGSISSIAFERDFVMRETEDLTLDETGIDKLISEIMDFAHEALNSEAEL